MQWASTLIIIWEDTFLAAVSWFFLPQNNFRKVKAFFLFWQCTYFYCFQYKGLIQNAEESANYRPSQKTEIVKFWPTHYHTCALLKSALKKKFSAYFYKKTRQAMYTYCNIQAHSCNHCCSRKAIRITYCKFVFSLSYPAHNAHAPYCNLRFARLYKYFSTLSHKRHDFQNKVQNMIKKSSGLHVK
jgi:hypothetical protein